MDNVEKLKYKMEYYSNILNERLVSNNFNLLDEEVIKLSQIIDNIHNDILKVNVS